MPLMALYDVPVHPGFKAITHTSHPLFLKNGFKQVGNTTIPANQVSAFRIAPSALFDKNLSGISEAGYGDKFPYRRLAYSGAGSPPSSIYRPASLSYAGAGSPKTSLGYAGAGSPRTSVYRPGLGYSGAGSPKASVLRDAYINDNPPPGTLTVIPLKKSLSGLADDPTVSPSTDFGVPIPPTSIWNELTGAIGSIFSSTVSAGTQAATNAVSSAINPPPQTKVQQAVTTFKSALPANILGMPINTALLLGAGVGAYFLLKR